MRDIAPRTLLAILALLLLAFAAAGQAADEPPPADPELRIPQLIAKLGSPHYLIRERAQQELAQIGLPAFDLLFEAQLHDDIEVALRAKYLVRKLRITWSRDDDPQTVRQGIAAKARLAGEGAARVVRVEVTNVGAAHLLPTTPTPAAWLEVALVDAAGKTLAARKQRIGRHIEWKGDRFVEHADTRIPPGETLVFAPRFEAAPAARSARVTLTMFPDDYYEGLYAKRLISRSEHFEYTRAKPERQRERGMARGWSESGGIN